MSLLITTQAEFLELVEELRGMATAAPTAKIRDELTRIADRYAAIASPTSSSEAAICSPRPAKRLIRLPLREIMQHRPRSR
jgi:hypothetical protein